MQGNLGECWVNIVSKFLQYKCSFILMYTLTSVISPSLMSLPLFYPKTLGRGCSQCNSPSLWTHFPPIYHVSGHLNNSRINTNHTLTCIIVIIIIIAKLTLYHSIRCVTCHTISLYSCIHVTATYLFNITCCHRHYIKKVIVYLHCVYRMTFYIETTWRKFLERPQ
jgi:hypothetical protein